MRVHVGRQGEASLQVALHVWSQALDNAFLQSGHEHRLEPLLAGRQLYLFPDPGDPILVTKFTKL